MTRAFQSWVVLIAWLLATGVQWDLLQVIAWGRMFVGYSETMRISEAVQKTFGGEMCCLCKAVKKAKEQQEELPSPDSVKGKFVLIHQMAQSPILAIPVGRDWPWSRLRPAIEPRDPPPKPPPRIG